MPCWIRWASLNSWANFPGVPPTVLFAPWDGIFGEVEVQVDLFIVGWVHGLVWEKLRWWVFLLSHNLNFDRGSPNKTFVL